MLNDITLKIYNNYNFLIKQVGSDKKSKINYKLKWRRYLFSFLLHPNVNLTWQPI